MKEIVSSTQRTGADPNVLVLLVTMSGLGNDGCGCKCLMFELFVIFTRCGRCKDLFETSRGLNGIF